MATLLRSAWTGTPGRVGSDLPYDVEEAVKIIEHRRAARADEPEFTPDLVARAYAWGIEAFGPRAGVEDLPLRQLVDLYIDS